MEIRRRFFKFMTTGLGYRYYPTGRWFYSNEGKLWEFMTKDNPDDVLFMKMPHFLMINFMLVKIVYNGIE